MIDTGIFLAFAENAILLVALVSIYSIFPSKFENQFITPQKLIIGLTIGLMGIILMMNPTFKQQGLILDLTTVLLCLAGLFWGGFSAFIAVIVISAYSVTIGAEQLLGRISLLILSAGSGVLWRHTKSESLDKITNKEFLLFGFATHVILLFCDWLFLPAMSTAIFYQTIVPVLVIFPLMFLVLGHLLIQVVFKEQKIHAKLQDDFLFRNQFNIGNIGIAITSRTKYWLKVNPYICKMLGYTETELTSLTWKDITYPADLEKDVVQFERMMRGEIEDYEMDKRFIAGDGSIIYTHMTVACRHYSKSDTLIIAGLIDITEQKKAEAALLEKTEQLSLALDSSDLGMWDWDLETNKIISNKRTAEILGCDLTQLNHSPKLWFDAIEKNNRLQLFKTIAQIKQGKIVNHSIEYKITTMKGETRWILDTGKVVSIDADGYPIRMCGTHSDITSLKLSQESLRVAASVYNYSSEAMSVFNTKGIIIDVNPAFSIITGYSKEEVQQKPFHFLQSQLHTSSFYKQLRRDIRTVGHWQGEVWMRRKDGNDYLILLSINAIDELNQNDTANKQNTQFVALFYDITARKQSEDLIWKQANYDALTGLPNRRMLLAFLDKNVNQKRPKRFALMFLDLDFFKEINDTLGHDTGDILLIEAAKRLSMCVRESDIVARLGGDEFTIVLNDVTDSAVVERVANNILQSMSIPFELREQTAYISASVGITMYPDDAETTDALLKNADQAMYSSKAHGRNRFNYFTPTMQQNAQKRMKLIQDLKTAINEKQFELYYQPIINLADDSVVKAEALLRWKHPTDGFIPPDDFISIAEDTGMIIEIGNWVFEQATYQSARWKRMYGTEIQISINKSPVQFRDESTSTSSWLSKLATLHSNSICIEITEGLLLEREANVEAKLHAYRDAGIQVSLDDFGTGYSSLAYLKKFDIDYLKIDMSFVKNLETDSNDLSLCEAIIVMAHKLGIKVIAEGIETDMQRSLLEFAGCDFGQGYLFSRPIPAKEFEDKYFVQEQIANTYLNIEQIED